MKSKLALCTGLALSAVIFGGCDDALSSKQAKARPPAATPAPALAENREPLPYPNPAVAVPTFDDRRPALDVLIAKVQVSFNAAEKEYKAGEFDKARADYDRAVALIVASGHQSDSDPRLSDLIDQIGETLHSYDVNARQDAGDEEENPSTPAPIDELTDLTLPAGDPRLAAIAEKELMRVQHDLPLTVNSAVLQDLMYLAQAESAFQPTAVSKAGARGLWQFMPFRGEEYELDRTFWVDERSDPEKATRAAARHMRDLYDMFGDWYLVMAAYNAGPMNVVKGVERTGYADFWELSRLHALPKQTQNYVPIIIALALVGKDPALYGVEVAPEKPAATDVIYPKHSIDLHLVADATGADIDDLRSMNPELLRNVTPNDPNFGLKLPAGYGGKFQDNIGQVPQDKWTSWRLHKVESGETLGDIARHYRVTVPAIELANHLELHATVPAGFMLNIPAAPPIVRLGHYRAVRGDTLEGIAERFDVTVAELKRWNNIHGSSAPRGSRLRIYAGGSPDDSSRSKVKSAQSVPGPADPQNVSAGETYLTGPRQHRVKQGETLYSIAHAYKVSVDNLREANPFLAERPIQPGDLLAIPP